MSYNIITKLKMEVKLFLYKFFLAIPLKLLSFILFILGLAYYTVCVPMSIFICMLAIISFFILKKVNDYIVINIFTGTVYMNARLRKKHLKETSDEGILKELLTGFADGLGLIPSTTKSCFFRLFKDEVVTVTHGPFIEILKLNLGNEVSISYKKDSVVREKLFKYSFKDVWNLSDLQYNKLMEKAPKAKITIEIDTLEIHNNKSIQV